MTTVGAGGVLTVMRVVLALALVLLFAGCGGTEPGGTTSQQTPAEPSADQLPQGEPPGKPEQGPPAAWVSTEAGARWLGFSTYCWETTCADYIAPACDEPHVPTLELHRGETVQLILEFEPRSLSLSYLPEAGKPVKLDTEDPSWTADREGVFAVFATTAKGDASYVGCAQLAD